MGILAKLLIGAGLPERLAGFVSLALIAAVAGLALLWIRADAYGDGKRAENARWEAAQRVAERKAAQSAGKASAAAIVRERAHSERVEREKEKIDEAEREGGSPFDVLFGPAGLSE